MIRGYLTSIVVIGVFASIAGGIVSAPSASSSSGDRPRLVAGKASSDWSSGTVASAVTEPTDGSVRLERESNGHFYADVQVNGAIINALVDTGASGIALSREDARKAGLATSIGMPNVIGQGADGEVYGEIVTLDSVSLGGTTVEGLQAMVLNSGEQTLLGQDFLAKFDSVEIHGDTMVLR
jgi:aspartyl protease family protein